MERLLAQHPNRVPVHIERSGTNIPDIDRHKYLVPDEMTVGQFVVLIRKRVSLKPYQGMFVFVNDTMVPNTMNMGEVYTNHASSDRMLYMKYSGENVFG